jgi:hypothetical protein
LSIGLDCKVIAGKIRLEQIWRRTKLAWKAFSRFVLSAAAVTKVIAGKIRLKHIGRRTKLIWKAFSSFVLSAAAVATVIYLGFLILERITQHSIEIAPISVTKDLDDRGYTPTVVADQLRDALNELIAKARSSGRQSEDISLKGEQPDITVPNVGLSVDAIVASITPHLPSNRINGASELVVGDQAEGWVSAPTGRRL